MNAYATPRALEMALKAAAKASPLDTNRAIANFYFHRLLCRIFHEQDSAFVLKGGLGLLARTTDARYTRDIDLATREPDAQAAIEELERRAAADLNDFVSFRLAYYTSIRVEDAYRAGYRIVFDAFLGTKHLQSISVDLVADPIDVGTPDIITPADRIDVAGVPVCDYPIYPSEKALADKVCGIMELHNGHASSRVKDLVDIVIYARNVFLESDKLALALERETGSRKLVLEGGFRLPPEWDATQERQYAKLVERTGIPQELRCMQAAEALAQQLIDPCLGTPHSHKLWNPTLLQWEPA